MTAAVVATYTKDPSATLDYGLDWGAKGWLLAGDTITASTFTVDAGLTKGTTTNDTTTTTVWLSGGTDQTDYLVVNHITTAAGRQDERTFKVKVRNR
jgi:hypothetical protein